jgi:hypothetical protein
MNKTLGSLRWDTYLAYLNDNTIYSSCFGQHLIDVDEVCGTLNAANFKLDSEKCSLFQTEISFLGHHMNANGCSPTSDNIRAISRFPTPQSTKVAHSCLQMAGFYRRFIPDFTRISFPLNKFTRKNLPFVWTQTEQVAFDQLKPLIVSPTVLMLPDPLEPYIVLMDAPLTGIGAVLLQKSPSSSFGDTSTLAYRPIACA